jgi:hypothetical protein
MQRDELSLSQLLFLYVWPFWMFRDASRGTSLERAAAYRHNCEKRIHLPGYIWRWTVLCALLLSVGETCRAAALEPAPMQGLLTGVSQGAGMLFTVAFCILMMTGYTYLRLSTAKY